jgi:hypothetical protein
MPGMKFDANAEVYKLMKDLIGNYHPDLAICVDEIGIIMEEKASKQNGKAVMGRAKKASDEFSILPCPVAYKFVVYLPADEWQQATNIHQEAMLDRQLCSLKTEPDPEDPAAEPKYKVVKPDATYFRDEFERYGAWLTSGASPTDTLIEELFGAKEEDVTEVPATREDTGDAPKTSRGRKGVSVVI